MYLKTSPVGIVLSFNHIAKVSDVTTEITAPATPPTIATIAIIVYNTLIQAS